MKKLLLILLLLVSSLFANIAKVTAIKGEVIIQRDAQNIVAKLGSVIKDKDTIKTDATSRAQIIFKDNTIISVGKNSLFSIENYLYEPKKPVVAKFKFGNGVFKTITGKIGKISPEKFQLTTKTSSIGIRGTIVGLESQNEVDTIIVPQGQVEVITPEGPVIVNAGQMVQSAVGVKPEVTSIPEVTQEKMEQDSGASSNEQESGQGESTQTTALTQEEQEEAQGQQSAEEEAQKEEAKEKQNEESNEEASEESAQGEQEEQSEESGTTQDSDTDASTEESGTEETQTSVATEPTDNVDEPDTNIEINTEVEVVVDEPDIQIDVPDVSAVVDDVVSDLTETVDDTTDDSSEVITQTAASDDSTTTDDTSTSEDTTSSGTTTTVANYTASLSGYQLAAATGSAMHAYNFKLYGETSMSIAAGGTFNLGAYTLSRYSNSATTSESISGSFNYDSFTIPSLGAYTGHADATTWTFSRDIGGTTYTPTYTIHADNTAEFIVGYTSNENINNPIDFYDLFYDGVKASISTLSTGSVYAYKGFKGLSVVTSSGNVFDESGHIGIEDLSSEIMYINPVTKSIHFVEPSHLYGGAYNYNSGHIHESDSSLFLRDIDYNNGSYTNVGTSTGQLYGTNAQGIGAYSSDTEYGSYGLSGQVVNGTHEGAFTYYYDSTKTISYSGTQSFTGYVSYLRGLSTIGDTTFSLSVNRDSGAITGSIGDGSLSLSFNGTTDDSLSSYYIHDDLFGVLVDSGSYSSETLIANSGFLVSVPDSYNSGNYANYDDESSWGYWTSEFSNSGSASMNNIDPRSTWVAGIETAVSAVNSTPDATYNGHVLGAVSNGTNTYPILFNANNNVSLNFTFGTGTSSFSGSMAFDSSAPSNPSWSASVSGSSADNIAFSGSGSGSGAGGTINSSSVNGKFYGTGSVKSVGGQFKFGTTVGYDAFGVFKATKSTTVPLN